MLDASSRFLACGRQGCDHDLAASAVEVLVFGNAALVYGVSDGCGGGEKDGIHSKRACKCAEVREELRKAIVAGRKVWGEGGGTAGRDPAKRTFPHAQPFLCHHGYDLPNRRNPLSLFLNSFTKPIAIVELVVASERVHLTSFLA